MVFVILFVLAQLLVSTYALWRGGAPERYVGVMLIVAASVDWLLPTGPRTYHTVFWPELAVDLVLLAGLSLVAMFADRFWPMWVAACQLLTVAGHGVRAYDPQLWNLAYWFITGSIAYPMLALLGIGVARHRRRSLDAVDFSWTPQRHRYDRAERSRTASS